MVDNSLEAGQQRRLKMIAQEGAQQLVQIGLRGFRLFFQHLHHSVAAKIGSHQNNGVAKINFSAFTISHETAVKYLVKQVYDVAMRFFYFIQQYHAIGAFSHGFSQDPSLTITHIPRR